MLPNAAIWWIRRDLRLRDNPALHAALQAAQTVIPVFILDPGLMQTHSIAPARQFFLLSALQNLDTSLRQRGSRLILRSGKPEDALREMLAQTGAGSIFAESDHSPYARQRDDTIRKSLPLKLIGAPTLRTPQEVLKADGSPYTVYTPYMRAWKAAPLPAHSNVHPEPEQLPAVPSLHSEALPSGEYPFETLFPTTENQAHQRLDAFVRAEDPPIYRYHTQRDLPAEPGTSKLSPYLRFGLLSARQVVLAALDAHHHAPTPQARQGAETWLNELIWREFYSSILYHFPHVLQRSYRPDLEDIRWREDEAGLLAWQEGRTGFPIIDAAMRELKTCGWMHNRTRMISASFLVKNLLIDWRRGEQWFMQHLLDGDPAANNGGWQWTAGTGTDAAPYFRVFNPVLQGRKFDPAGIYVRRWIPELHAVPDRYLHAPWEMPYEVQQSAHCIIGQCYPRPIVDLRISRERALLAYAEARQKIN